VKRYDFIIVGGGSAGCVLANRLSADPATSVLLLEAGRPDSWWDLLIHMPGALTFPIGNPFYDWKYESEPEPYLNGRRIYHARGKLLGGSSSINGMIFQRGNPLDYERWAADPGMKDWDYAHCLPYFKKMETSQDDSEFRGHDGPLVLERGPATNPLFTAFFEAAQQAGHTFTTDVNGYRQEGFGPFDRNIRRGRRYSAARAYLHPVLGRKNLTVRTRTLVHRIPLEGMRAVGVEHAMVANTAAPSSAAEVHLTPRNCCNCPASVPRTNSRNSASTLSSIFPLWGKTCRTTWRSTSNMPAPSRYLSSPRWRNGSVRSSARNGSSCARAPARRTTSRAADSRAATTLSPIRI
jgi:choline dehydrogenase